MKHLITVFFAITLLSSCIGTRPDFLPTPSTFHTFQKGHHFEGSYGTNRALQEIFGEMICMSDTSLVLLSKEYGLTEFKKSKINGGYIALSLATNGTEVKKLKTLNTVSTIATITHGWWWLITIPVNVAVIMKQSSKSTTGTYAIRYNRTPWNDLKKFCRFPQGLPDNIKLEDIVYIKNFDNTVESNQQ